MVINSLTLDYTNAREDVQDVNTLLQKLLDRFYRKFDGIVYENGVFSNEVDWYLRMTTNGGVTKESDHYYVWGETSKITAYSAKVDLTLFNRLEIVAKNQGSTVNTVVVGIASDVPLEYTDFNIASQATQTTKKTHVFDVSNLSGEYYIGSTGFEGTYRSDIYSIKLFK